MTELTIVRENLMNDPLYTPYCGNNIAAREPHGCYNPRTVWDSKKQQFVCPACNWTSQIPQDFINRYIKKWNIK